MNLPDKNWLQFVTGSNGQVLPMARRLARGVVVKRPADTKHHLRQFLIAQRVQDFERQKWQTTQRRWSFPLRQSIHYKSVTSEIKPWS
jgi:hypothetical protein